MEGTSWDVAQKLTCAFIGACNQLREPFRPLIEYVKIIEHVKIMHI